MHVPLLIFLQICLNLVSAAPQNALLSSSESTYSINYALNGRIVNGEKAALRQFPHQVSLRRSWSTRHFCGGGIISEYYVLTAAHCMYMDGKVIQPWTIMIVAGQLQLSKPSSTTQKRGVDKFIIHSKFDLHTLHNDLALLELKVPFTMTPEVSKVPLAAQPPPPDTICQISGWGYPAENIPITNNDLMYVDIPIVSVEKCRELLVNVTLMPPGMFCAGYLEGGKDACQGDSGGSMVCNGVLTGVISGGEGCALPRLPGLYADVSFYKDWIEEHATVHSINIFNTKAAGHHTAMITLIISLLLLLGPSQL